MRNWTFQPPAGTPINLQHPQARGLVGMWMLNEGGGGTAFRHGIEARNGTHNGTTSFHVGPRGRATGFNGSDAYVDGLGDFSRYNYGSVSLWCRGSLVGTGTVFAAEDKAETSFDEHLRIDLISNGFRIIGKTTAQVLNVDRIKGDAALSANTWIHFVVTMSASGSLFFVDGLPATTAVYNTGTASTVFWFADTDVIDSAEIGRLSDSSSAINYLDGQVSDVRIYDRALTGAEVLDLYVNPYGIFNRRRTVAFVPAAPAGEAPPNFPWQSMMGYGA